MAQLFNADEIFAMGVQIEKNGVAFYTTAANNTEDTDLKNLFLQLAEWEHNHVKLFENLRMKLDRHQKDGLKEYPTRTIFIDPLLQALGWDVREPDEVELEYPTIDASRSTMRPR